MRQLALFAVLTAVLLAGCAKEKEEPKGINIEFPGGNVRLGEDGVDVKAPGVGVTVDDERVDVNAPNVDVQYERGKKVGVKASGVDVNVESGGAKGP